MRDRRDGRRATRAPVVAALADAFAEPIERAHLDLKGQFGDKVDVPPYRRFVGLDAYEKATTEGDRRGAVMFGDEMIDEASRKMALKFVSRGERAGMSRSS